MDALKRQVMQMTKDIEAANHQRKDLDRLCKKVEERATIAEAEAKSLQGRIKMLNESYEKSCVMLSERAAQFHAKGEEADDSEKVRKLMEVKEFENVDDITMMEVHVANARRHEEEICKKQNDAVARLVKVEADKALHCNTRKWLEFERRKIALITIQSERNNGKLEYNKLKVELSNALERLNTAESRIIALQEESDYETRKLLKLEYRDNCYDKRADYFEDAMERLDQSYGIALQVEDESFVIAKQLTTERDKLRTQVQSWNKRVTNLRRELEGTLADINRF